MEMETEKVILVQLRAQKNEDPTGEELSAAANGLSMVFTLNYILFFHLKFTSVTLEVLVTLPLPWLVDPLMAAEIEDMPAVYLKFSQCCGTHLSSQHLEATWASE